jgi:hypothetical protein
MVKIFNPAFAAFCAASSAPVVVVLAVGEQHEHLVMVVFLERGQRGVDGRGDGRAALRNRIHVQRLHALLKRRVVNRQRTFQKRVAGERDQPHPVRAGLLHQFQRGELGARQPVRRDVGRQHALGSVHRHDDVQSALLDFLQIKSMLRPGQRDDQQAPRRTPDIQTGFSAAWAKCRRSIATSSRASMNCTSNFCRARIAHQKNASSAGGITSSSHKIFGCSNLIFKS